MSNRTANIAAIMIIASVASASQIPAFPGAEGFGAFAVGGRGGAVIAVTNLNDSGPGSFRAALEETRGPRTIVFRTGGVIELKRPLHLRGDSHVTIAGQTAPGGGICLKNYPIMFTDCQHIIVRYIRSRPGDTGTGEHDAMSIRGSSNIIIDHCSMSWSIDSIQDLTHATGNATVQWSILSEALSNSRHSKGAHSYATGWDGKGAGGASYHHNFLASCDNRMPRIDKFGTPQEGPLVDVRNNVIYNWGRGGAYGGENARMNWVANYYRPGPSSRRKNVFFMFSSPDSRMYIDGNYMDGNAVITQNNRKGVTASSSVDVNTLLVDRPFAVPFVTTQTAAEAARLVIARAGASLPVRDAVDARIINDFKNRTGRIIDSQSEVGGWPVYDAGQAPLETDGDGMPDEWELKYGFGPNDSSDGPIDSDGDGYTNLEEYLNNTNPREKIDYTLPQNNVDSLQPWGLYPPAAATVNPNETR
ncbi:MAG TPA: hypothetical protein VLH60_07430 [Sedimentisphaerales bacterium]|nr:hypothetical protein [Sedimentisphaerales bacterium]